MKRVAFISHSSTDKAIGDTVCSFLEANGIPCWIAPRDVVPGKNYGVAIVDGIDECGVLVLILSAASNKSGQVVREVERAASGNAVIIPVRVEPVQPSRDLEFYVSSSHWLDATDKPLEKHLGSLVDAIRNWQNEGEPRETGAPPNFSHAPASSHRHTLPFVIGGIAVAVAVIGLAIFMANRPRNRPPPPTAVAMSPGNQANAPKMALNRRRGPRGPGATELGAPNTPAPINEPAGSPAPNETAAPGPPPVIDHVTASSERPPITFMGALRHFDANQAFDGDLKTAWIPVGPGTAEWVEVFFKTPTEISSVSIFSGNSNAARFSMFNRVREIRMSFPNGFSRVLTLADKMEMQRFALPHHPVLQSIKFEIVSVYPGNKNDATPITEIEFNRPE